MAQKGDVPANEDLAVGNAVLPPGMLAPYAGAAAPAGWLLADGSEKAVATYPALDAVLGTLYGPRTNGAGGVGVTHFRLPNLLGRVPVGRDAAQVEFDTLGDTPGAKTVTLAETDLPVHAHSDGTLAAAAHSHADGTLATAVGGDHNHGASPGGNNFMTVNGTISLFTVGFGTDRAVVARDGAASVVASGVTNNGGSHAHDVTGATATAVADVTGSTGSVGAGDDHDNVQPSLVVNYIVKT